MHIWWGSPWRQSCEHCNNFVSWPPLLTWLKQHGRHITSVRAGGCTQSQSRYLQVNNFVFWPPLLAWLKQHGRHMTSVLVGRLQLYGKPLRVWAVGCKHSLSRVRVRLATRSVVATRHSWNITIYIEPMISRFWTVTNSGAPCAAWS